MNVMQYRLMLSGRTMSHTYKLMIWFLLWDYFYVVFVDGEGSSRDKYDTIQYCLLEYDSQRLD